MREQDIRPKQLMQTYVDLCARDAEACFSDQVVRREIPCVACGSDQTEEQFTKHGFGYVRCQSCGTLYQSPRPEVEAFEAFYKNSESSRYWAEVFFPSVAEARREKIIRPRVERLLQLCSDVELNVESLIDVGAGYGVFLDEWRKCNPATELIAVEPSISLAQECRNKGLTVVESIAENVTGYDNYADLVVCFEVLEHVDDPLEFVRVLKSMVKSNGYVFVSTLCIDGFDLQMLWEKSSQISPPHHINFHSVKGFKMLFERAGLDNITITTPGVLDVDIVKNFLNSSPGTIELPPLIESILADDARSASFQQFLSDNQLSSHAWILGKKTEINDD